MMGGMFGMGVAMMILMILGGVLLIAVLVLVVLAIVWLARRLSRNQAQPPAGRNHIKE